MQITIAVNKKNDALIDCQKVNENSFINLRFAYRMVKDASGKIREIVRV